MAVAHPRSRQGIKMGGGAEGLGVTSMKAVDIKGAKAFKNDQDEVRAHLCRTERALLPCKVAQQGIRRLGIKRKRMQRAAQSLLIKDYSYPVVGASQRGMPGRKNAV